MKKRKPKKYIVVLAYNQGESNGVPTYYLKYVSDWPEGQLKWGVRFEVTANPEQAIRFGRDTALYVANTIRMRNAVAATVMVEEA